VQSFLGSGGSTRHGLPRPLARGSGADSRLTVRRRAFNALALNQATLMRPSQFLQRGVCLPGCRECCGL
jgi:hypothetical protein